MGWVFGVVGFVVGIGFGWVVLECVCVYGKCDRLRGWVGVFLVDWSV